MRFIQHGPAGKAFAVTPDKKMHRWLREKVKQREKPLWTFGFYPLARWGANPCFSFRPAKGSALIFFFDGL
jgi:hypothetical protein